MPTPLLSVFMRVCNFLEPKIQSDFPQMPFLLDGKIKALYEMKRGFRLIFQVGGPTFLHSANLFPAHKCVEICACQIDKFAKAQNVPKSSPQNTMGQCVFFMNTPAAMLGSFLRLPSHTLHLILYQLGKNKITLSSNSARISSFQQPTRKDE